MASAPAALLVLACPKTQVSRKSAAHPTEIQVDSTQDHASRYQQDCQRLPPAVNRRKPARRCKLLRPQLLVRNMQIVVLIGAEELSIRRQYQCPESQENPGCDKWCEVHDCLCLLLPVPTHARFQSRNH